MSTLASSLSCTESIAGIVGSDSNQAPSDANILRKFRLYETQSRFYMFGADKGKKCWKVIKIDRCEPAELHIFEDPTLYSRNDINDLLRRLDAGNQPHGLKFVTKAYGIVGFIKFLEPYYILLVTKRHPLGSINGHSIYGIGETQLIAITHPDFQTKVASSHDESRYTNLFNSIDLTQNFFFSYTYRIMWSLQKNSVEINKDTIPHDGMFVWNAFLTSGIRLQMKNLQWLVAIVHGFFHQIELVHERTAVCKLTLIARRSRHFAGTRYFKRGVNDDGDVATDVETEQLVHEELEGKPGRISSFVQQRGSIPLFWSQDASVLSPRPDIQLGREDLGYKATKLHFENLGARYDYPVIVLSLLKTKEKKPRETKIGHEYTNAVNYLNQSLSRNQIIQFVEWDLQKSTSGPTNVLEAMGKIVADALSQVGFYCSSEPTWTTHKANACGLETSKLQHGVVRANCIDCLDRTNIAQMSFGLAALGQQLQALGLLADGGIEIDSKLGRDLKAVYEMMGDVLALQYGGSTAHKNAVLSKRQRKWKAGIRTLYLLRALKRHFNNIYWDGLKQDAINIFLGKYQPELGKPLLWQLDYDTRLRLRRGYCDGDAEPVLKRTLSTGSMRKNGPVIFSNRSLVEYVKNTIGKNIPPSPDQEAVDCNIQMSADWSLLKEQDHSLPKSVLLLPRIIVDESFVMSGGEDEGRSECTDINSDNGKGEKEEGKEEEGTKKEDAAHHDLDGIDLSSEENMHKPFWGTSESLMKWDSLSKDMEEPFWGTSESFVKWVKSDYLFLL